MASAGCRCKRGAGAVAVEVRILCRSAVQCSAVQVQHSWQALGMACDVLRWDETKQLAYLDGLCRARAAKSYGGCDVLAEVAIVISYVAVSTRLLWYLMVSRAVALLRPSWVRRHRGICRRIALHQTLWWRWRDVTAYARSDATDATYTRPSMRRLPGW
jgi:hypothetical protein